MDRLFLEIVFPLTGSEDGSDLDSSSSSTSETSRPPLIVRNEEIVIVSVVLFIWISVILIFINRWGRIRMLEPYLPDYKSPSIPSLSPMLPKRSSRISINIDPPSATDVPANHISRQLADITIDKPMFSSQMYLNRMCGGNQGAGASSTGTTSGLSGIPMRPRGNSVITGSTACMLAVEGFNTCRKTRSVENIPRIIAVKTSKSTDI